MTDSENVENRILQRFPVCCTVHGDLTNQHPVDLFSIHRNDK